MRRPTAGDGALVRGRGAPRPAVRAPRGGRRRPHRPGRLRLLRARPPGRPRRPRGPVRDAPPEPARVRRVLPVGEPLCLRARQTARPARARHHGPVRLLRPPAHPGLPSAVDGGLARGGRPRHRRGAQHPRPAPGPRHRRPPARVGPPGAGRTARAGGPRAGGRTGRRPLPRGRRPGHRPARRGARGGGGRDPPAERVRGRPALRDRRDLPPPRHVAGDPGRLGGIAPRGAPTATAPPPLVGAHRRPHPALLAPARAARLRQGHHPAAAPRPRGLCARCERAGRGGPGRSPLGPPLRDPRPPRGVPGRARPRRDGPSVERPVALPAGAPAPPVRPRAHHAVRGAAQRPVPPPPARGPARRDPPVASRQDGGLLPELRAARADPRGGPRLDAPPRRGRRVAAAVDGRPVAVRRGVQEGPRGERAARRHRRADLGGDRLPRRGARGRRGRGDPLPPALGEARGAAAVRRRAHRQGLGVLPRGAGPTGPPPGLGTTDPVGERPRDRDRRRPSRPHLLRGPPRPRAARRPRGDGPRLLRAPDPLDRPAPGGGRRPPKTLRGRRGVDRP